MKIMFASLGNKNKKKISRDDILKSLYGYTYIEKKQSIRNNIKDRKNITQKSNKKDNRLNIKEKITDIKKQHEFFNNSMPKRSIKDKHVGKNNITNNKDIFNSIVDYTINNFSFFKSCLLSVFTISMLFFVINHAPVIKDNIFKLASNIFVANKNIDAKELIKLYGIYNEKNYVINTEKIDVASEEKIEESVVTSSEIELIDKNVNVEDKAVFMNTIPDITATITEETKSLQRVTLGTMKILNYSSTRDIDYNELLNKNITLTKMSDKILLYNTHTSESYTNSEGYVFDYSGTMRSVDANYNMIAIAKKLNENLIQKGFSSIQNTTPHDYGTYTSAYAKSRATVQEALSQMQGAGIIIDVHRDASANLAYRPVANVNRSPSMSINVCNGSRL